MSTRRPTALLVGSTSRDLDLARPEAPARPGGTVLHAGLALAALGVETRVVTRVAPADAGPLLAPLRAAGVSVRALPSAATTTYANDYRGVVERHELRATSDPLTIDDVPTAWREADLVQLGPLHQADLRPSLAAGVRGLRGLDLQGLVRAPAGGAGPRVAPDLAEHLAAADVVQASEHELPIAAGDASPTAFRRRYAIRELVITRGPRGASVLGPAGSSDVPAPPSSGRFPRGAGDVFLAIYLLARAGGTPVPAAAEVAARATALRISDGTLPRTLAGLPHFGTPR